MLAEFALFALIMALGLSLLQGMRICGFNQFILLLQSSTLLSFCLILFAFVVLVLLRVDSDFSILNVAENSNLALPMLYKIAGTWGNHEGSMLLWVLVLSGFAAVLACSQRSHDPLIVKTLVVQAVLVAGTLLFILATSNPFARQFPPPLDGAMLNPLLQDMALAIHPPMLYGGYVGFSIVFSFAVAGLWNRDIGREWADSVHPWIMLSWSLLTLGIGLGSWWAYRELGWGGFWFWDPVENASLLPWLAGTALLHSNVVLKKRGLLAGWVVLLAIVTFGLSMLGTFLVRSGMLTSVHSFASDPARGLFILGFIAVTMGGALWLYASRIGGLIQPTPMRPSSREGMIVINNLFLMTACITVLIGTLYPMLAEGLMGRSVSVGAPYYNLLFPPLMALPLLFAGLTPFLPWKKAAFLQSVDKAWPALACAVIAGGTMLSVAETRAVASAGGLALATYLLVASARWLSQGKWKKAAHWPVFLGHIGAALVVFAVTGVGLWSKQAEGFIAPGESMIMGQYRLEYGKEQPVVNKNYVAKRAHIKLYKGDEYITELTPEYRHYKIRKTQTSEVSIYSTLAYDFYSVIGEDSPDKKKRSLRVYIKPTVSFLWLGCVVMTVGGLLAALFGLRNRKEGI